MHNMCFVFLFSATMIVNRDKRLNIRCKDEILDQLLRETNAVDTRTPADRDRFYAMAIKGHLGTRNDKGVLRINGDSSPLEELKAERRWREDATDGRRRFVGLYIEKGFPLWAKLVLEELQLTETELGNRDADPEEQKAHQELKRLRTMLQKEIAELHKTKRGTSNPTPWGKDGEADAAKTGPTPDEEARVSPALQDGDVRKLSLRNLTRPTQHVGRTTTDTTKTATDAKMITSIN